MYAVLREYVYNMNSNFYYFFQEDDLIFKKCFIWCLRKIMNLNLTVSDYNSIYYENCTSLLLLVSYYFQYIFFFSLYFKIIYIYILFIYFLYKSNLFFILYSLIYCFILSLMNFSFYLFFLVIGSNKIF
jgi:hypothetical protein